MEDLRTLYYDVIQNYLLDDNGSIVYDIFKLITPNDLLMFKKNKDDSFISCTDGSFVELIYPSPEEIRRLCWTIEHHRSLVKYRTQK